MDDRFQVLETKLAYHDHEMAELNQVIFRQQQAIDALSAQLKRVTEQLKELGIAGDEQPQQIPPHY